MEPILVLYARGAMDEILQCICEISKEMGFSLWSLSGDPCAILLRLPTISRRICIIDAKEFTSDHIPEDQVLGTVHILRTSHIPLQCRISFHLEDLSGEPLAHTGKQGLQRFCAKSYIKLDSSGLLIEEGTEMPGTSPFQLPNVQVDTGPLHA